MNLEWVDSLLATNWVFIVIAATVIIVAAAVLSHLSTKFLKRILEDESNPLPSNSIFSNIARALIWIIAICIILNVCFGIDMTAVIAALGVGGIALSFGLQDTLANLVGGLQLTITKLIVPGERIKVGDEIGVVTDITWRHVLLVTDEGKTVIIPNAAINKAALTKLEG